MAKKRNSKGMESGRFERAVEWVSSLGIPTEKAGDIWSLELDAIESDSLAFKVLALACDPEIGPQRAYAILQAALRKDCGFYGPGRNVDITGELNASTVAAANEAVLESGQEHVLKTMLIRVERYYRSLQLKDPKKVWRKRVWKIYEPAAEDGGEAPETSEAAEGDVAAE